MNKDLTPLEALEKIKNYIVDIFIYERIRHDECPDLKLYVGRKYGFEIIETALKRLEIIDRLNEKHCEDMQTKLDDFEWLKHKLNLTFINSLSSPEDKERIMKIMGVEYGKEN